MTCVKVSGTAEMAGIRVRYPLLDSGSVGILGEFQTNLKLKGMENAIFSSKR